MRKRRWRNYTVGFYGTELGYSKSYGESNDSSLSQSIHIRSVCLVQPSRIAFTPNSAITAGLSKSSSPAANQRTETLACTRAIVVSSIYLMELHVTAFASGKIPVTEVS